MNTKIFTVLATTFALAAASAAVAAPGDASKAAAEVTFHEPEEFTDFRRSDFYSERDAQSLQKEITDEIARHASGSLPPGYTLNIRFTDIDLAGDINPMHQPNLSDVRIYRGVFIPRLTFDYTLTDAQGETVASGSEKLVDMGYDMRVRMPSQDYTRIETEMMRDFISNLSRNLAKGKA